jgi:DNA (cytosine-5)-methyltransferase 1
VDITEKLPRILGLCTGYGGLETGIERVVGKCTRLAYVEIEAFAVANLVNKMETGQMDPVPIWTDIKTFPVFQFHGMVDILTAGYPCQPFSCAGKQLGERDPRHLWPHIRRIISECHPEWCFFENVEGHIRNGLREVLTDLVDLGYSVEGPRKDPTWGLFSASEVGAPHQRKRVFILARRFNKDVRNPDGNKMANSDSSGLSYRGRKITQEALGMGESVTRCSEKWPSRPGELQYKWEKPRALVNPDNIQRRAQAKKSCDEQTQSRLGRTVDGGKNRTDRLRLLGNGVVPATAAKAFYNLLMRY